MKPVLPSITGRVGSARNTVRAVRMPNALDGLGESISRFGKGLGGAANAVVGELTQLQKERNEEAYMEAYTAFEAEMDKQVNDLVQEGGNAVYIPEQITNIYEQGMAKYGQNLRGTALDRFRHRALTRRNAQVRWGMDYENDRRRRNIAAQQKEQLKSGLELFGQTLDSELLDDGLRSVDDRYRGGKHNMLPIEALEKFDKNYNRKEGTFTIPDRVNDDGSVTKGKTLKVGKDIPAEKVELWRGDLVRNADAYKKERQRLIDLYISKGVESILETGEVEGASLFYRNFQYAGYRVSERAQASIESVLNKQMNAKYRNERISTQMDALAAATLKSDRNAVYSQGGRYLTPEVESRMTEYLTDLQRKAESGDPDDVQNFKTASTMWNNRKRLMEQQEKADYAVALKDMIDNGKLSVDKIDGTLEKLRQGAPTAITSRLYETALKQKAALERKIPQKDLTMIKNEIFLRLADPSPYSGFISIDEQQKSYDLKDEKDRHAVMLYYGFDKSQIQAIDRDISRGAYKYTSDAAHKVAEVLNLLSQTKKFTAENVLAIAPSLVTEVMSVVNMWTDDPTKYKNYTNEMKQHLLKLCVQLTAEERRAFWFDKDYTVLSYLEQGIGEDGRAIRDENGKVKYSFDRMVESYLTLEGRRIFQRCRAEAAAFANGKIWYSDSVPENIPGFPSLPKNKEAK